METPGLGLKRGALDLLGDYCHDQRKIAEAYVKGDLLEHQIPFVWDVISSQDVEEARERLDRSVWRLEERVAKLEEEIKALQTKVRPPSTTSPYQPRSLPRR